MPSKKPRTKKPVTTVTPIPTKPQPTDSVAGDGDFKMLRRLMQETFAAIPVTEPLFLVESADLFDVFLGALPASLRQHYTCRACRHFVNRFGGLVTVQPDGSLRSAVWPSLDKMQHPALGTSLNGRGDVDLGLRSEASRRMMGFRLSGCPGHC